MKLPPLVAAVSRSDHAAPIRGVAAQAHHAHTTLENFTLEEHRENMQISRLAEGHGCDHDKNMFWSECAHPNKHKSASGRYVCCPLKGGKSYRAKYDPATGNCSCT
jgi:hypothetical protein